ncbi:MULTISPECIES: spermidine/putrescine ABC transporter ATP-binding protein PotA [unclassified Tatumella]|uniref:spermidine/putrescine ABC transporter ATP-binding protein PotA n=1 Tax=unclassified Tatumella TaxID=2649542 RepID=UPI001BB0AFE1|nr:MULTISPECIES: spermidine/putrescine ABC transporter ATP-binding protein PotA [unclassified Tatumella]MBS0877626.1 spermidine/putrescine ABC transporter ATP-binding protein PotA [Tatumella sp. JGM82]MBS0891331.1 spermidine/putrescine ABC transporter ATP-binding protein PotA [Tatumella sp. JGM94]MBS0902158.1 spermidine/putrescine ABC transporter ATP-binding protein PotA [Tatumella sp. JGM100]
MTQTCAQQALVTLSGISKAFDGKPVISGFDLTLGHGEFITLLGPSGCGKTTILRLIAGLETTDRGDIILDGRNITALPAEQRPVNTVFQSYALFPHMSVFDNVAFGLRMQKTPAAEIKRRTEEALAMVQLQDFSARRPAQLSGGQQQRVAIARAVINRPAVLLLDEPLSALDYKLRKQMQNELKALQRKLGITFIFVTHDQEEALTMSDRIVVLKDGHIEQDGTPREIYEAPASLFVAQFIGEINIFNGHVQSVQADGKTTVTIAGHPYSVDCPFPVSAGDQVHVLLRPEDLQLSTPGNNDSADVMPGVIRELNYKGSTLESVVILENGQPVTVSEFFNSNDPTTDFALNQKVSVRWIAQREVVLPYEADA